MPLGNKVAAAYYDREAAKHCKRAGDWAAQADKARTPANRTKYNEEAQKERAEAIACLEQAKALNKK